MLTSGWKTEYIINKKCLEKLFFVLVSIIIASFAVMTFVSLRESATMDELAHIPSGYSYLRYLDYRLNPEHPPLVKALSAIPLIFMGLRFPTDHSSWTNDVNGQWAAGNQFIYWSGNDADWLIFWARLGPIILTLLLTTLIYIWAKNCWALGGGSCRLFYSLFRRRFWPTAIMSPPTSARLSELFWELIFYKILFKPNGKNLIFAGLAFGVAIDEIFRCPANPLFRRLGFGLGHS